MSQDRYPTSERVYAAVKQAVLNGRYRPGERIDAARLADDHATSITPIRSALHRLAGEHLVEARASEGFYQPALSETRLRDLYAWNSHILSMAIQIWPPKLTEEAPSAQGLDHLRATADLFARIGERSDNEHCTEAILSLNDRLHGVRRLEPKIIGSAEYELATIAEMILQSQQRSLRRTIAAYHRRRIHAVPAVVQLAFKGGR